MDEHLDSKTKYFDHQMIFSQLKFLLITNSPGFYQILRNNIFNKGEDLIMWLNPVVIENFFRIIDLYYFCTFKSASCFINIC